MNYDLAVVGSGIAGLSCATLGAQAGGRVVLLEAHDKPGGCAGDFSIDSKWGRLRFPVGATAILGLEESGLHAQLFERLGVEIEAQKIEALRVFLPNLTLDWAYDARVWQRERSRLPGHRAAHELFWRAQEIVADAGWFVLGKHPFLPLQKPRDLRRNLGLLHPKLAPMALALPFCVGDLLRGLRLQNDRELVALVTLALLITVQSGPTRAPLPNGMAGLDLWRHGAFHPRGGAGEIAWKLLEGAANAGAQIEWETRVWGLAPSRGGWQISTSRGEFWAKNVVWNGVLPARFSAKPRFRGARWGAFTVYAAIQEAAIPRDFPLHAHILRAFAPRFPFVEAGKGDDVFLSLSASGDLHSAPDGMRTLNISTHVRLRDWAGLSPTDYRQKKREWRQKLLQHAAIALPDLPRHTRFALGGTPRSWEHYTLREAGFVGGPPLSRRNANLRAASIRTDFPGLYRVGDETFPGQGTLACVLSGWNAWREIEMELGASGTGVRDI